MARIEPGAHQPFAQPGKPALREQHIALAAVGQLGREDAVVLAGGEVHHLARRRQVGRQVGNRDVLDQDAEDLLVELVGERQLAHAPLRGEPGAADEEDHRLAAIGLLVQAPLPQFAGGDAALRR